ncbi:hypothetical protein Tco_1412952, partial [Tanacetum coccineum]
MGMAANGYNGIPSQLGGVVVDNNSLVSSGVPMDGSRNDVQNGIEGATSDFGIKNVGFSHLLLYGMLQKQKQLKKHVEYEQLINVLAMDKSRLEEELRATQTKMKLYDRLFFILLGYLLVVCVGFGMLI